MWLLFILNPVYLSTNSQYDSGNLPAQLPTPPLTFPHKEKSQCLLCWVYRGGGNGHLQFATILTAWSSVFDNPADHPTPPKPPPNQSPGKKKEIITKHDSTVCGRRNVKIMEKVCVMIVAVNLLTLLTLYSPEYQNTEKTRV